jgi:hypothetical protein
MKHHYAIDAVSATQNQDIAAGEARNAIERDLEWRRRYGRAGLHRFGNDISWQAVIVAHALHRHMKSVGQKRRSVEPIGAAKMLRDIGDPNRGRPIGKDREKQTV